MDELIAVCREIDAYTAFAADAEPVGAIAFPIALAVKLRRALQVAESRTPTRDAPPWLRDPYTGAGQTGDRDPRPVPMTYNVGGSA